MDLVEREGVNVRNAVIVSGITLTESDQMLESCLLKYGSIRRNLLIDDPQSEFHRNAVVEFTHSSAMCDLEPQLPLTLVSPTDADIVFHVCAMSTVYTPATSSATAECLEKLQAIASANGETLQDVLQRALMKVSGVKTQADASPRVGPGQEQGPPETSPLTSATSTPLRLKGFKLPSELRIEPENPVKVNIGAASPHF